MTSPKVAQKRKPVNTVHHVFAELQISNFGHDGEKQLWVQVLSAKLKSLQDHPAIQLY
jgi:hypothetical protein